MGRTVEGETQVGGSLLRVGMGQMLVIPGRPAENLARAHALVDRARSEGCDVLVLPECLDLGWTSDTARALATPVPGPVSQQLASMARRNSLLVAAGMTERDGDRIYNTALLFDADGSLLLRHRKIHEVDFARRVYHQGTTLGVARTRRAVLGLNICADNLDEGQALGLALGGMGAEVLLSPSAWAVRPEFDHERTPYGRQWGDAYRRIAQRTGMAVIGVSNVGPLIGGEWDGWQCIGASIAVGPDGTVLARGRYGEHAEDFLVAEVPLRPVRAQQTGRQDGAGRRVENRR